MHRLLQIFRVLTPDCREAARLQSRALDRRLSWLQRLGLRIHLLYCVWCRRYGRQILFLSKTAQHLDHVEDLPPLPPLPEDARARMRKALRAEKSKSPG